VRGRTRWHVSLFDGDSLDTHLMKNASDWLGYIAVIQDNALIVSVLFC
jgi:hypothetical protein